MNANEIADFLEKNFIVTGLILGDVQCMTIIKTLRFQQEEINALREQVQYLQTQVYGGTTK